MWMRVLKNTTVARAVMLALVAGGVTGCRTPGEWRADADDVAYDLIEQRQQEALGRTEPFTIERPADTLRRRLLLGQSLPYSAPSSLSTKDIEQIPQWPEDDYLAAPDDPSQLPPWAGDEMLAISLADALMIGARNSRVYQDRKELVFQTALSLDLELDQFRNSWFGILNSEFIADEFPSPAENGLQNGGTLELLRRLENGVQFGVRIGVDLVKLLTQDKASSWGVFGDATIAIPLMRGSGEFVVTEPLKQADRDLVYAIYDFERFKREYAVQVATGYLGVLQQFDAYQNAENNYRSLIGSTRVATRLAQVGDLPEIQVDQSKQDELAARNLWILEGEEYRRRLDQFKLTLGLPTDAQVELDMGELEDLLQRATVTLGLDQQYQPETDLPRADAPIVLLPPSMDDAGPLEIDPTYAVILGLQSRLDLRVAIGRVFDSQRVVAVAADNLRADLTLLGSARLGERRTLSDAGLPDADVRVDEGFYSALVSIDLPLERTAERNLYRNSIIAMEQAVRGVQELEDTIKFQLRDELRVLLSARESLQIQAVSVALGERRVRSTELFLQAGRADVRDVLEAREDLLEAQNLFTEALVRYRVAELELQRDLGLLEVDETGRWTEFRPDGQPAEPPAGGSVASGPDPVPARGHVAWGEGTILAAPPRSGDDAEPLARP